MLEEYQDGFGWEIYDYHRGKGGFEIIERDDGYFNIGTGPMAYFTEFEDWTEAEKEALSHARGTILDIGCGAGRHALYLQGLGYRVTGIDISPLAIKTCTERGLEDARIISVEQITPEIGLFDTILMMGNNFGLVGSTQKARELLVLLHSMTTPEGRIISQTRDPYQTDDPDHLAYHEFNRRNGRLPGQLRLKIHYKKYSTPWMDLLFLSPDELADVMNGTGWKIGRNYPDQSGVYCSVIEKE